MGIRNRCTHCGSDDLSVKLRELALIPGLDKKEKENSVYHMQVHRRLCKRCFDQANKEASYTKSGSRWLET